MVFVISRAVEGVRLARRRSARTSVARCRKCKTANTPWRARARRGTNISNSQAAGGWANSVVPPLLRGTRRTGGGEVGEGERHARVHRRGDATGSMAQNHGAWQRQREAVRDADELARADDQRPASMRRARWEWRLSGVLRLWRVRVRDRRGLGPAVPPSELRVAAMTAAGAFCLGGHHCFPGVERGRAPVRVNEA